MRRLATLGLAFCLAPMSRAADSKGVVEVAASGRAFYGWNYGWAITLSAQGRVLVEREPGKEPEAYILTLAERQALAARLEAERPWDVPAELGEAIVEGPERALEVTVAGRTARFVLRHTPQGTSRKSLMTDHGALARAFRICEAIRQLGRDVRLQPCADVP